MRPMLLDGAASDNGDVTAGIESRPHLG